MKRIKLMLHRSTIAALSTDQMPRVRGGIVTDKPSETYVCPSDPGDATCGPRG